MKFDIKHRYTDAILYSGEGETIAAVVTQAVKAGADLADAYLTGANLADADLADAYLAGAYLADANLAGADLTGAYLAGAYLAGANLADAYLAGAYLARADLTGANLADADLADAYLAGAYLARADLTGADLTGADLAGANLADAYLARANLTGAYLEDTKVDYYDVLSAAPAEVPALLAALREGRVDGSTYEGECACLVGTIANIKHCNFKEIEGITPNSSRPAEAFFLAIRKGDTPKTNQAAALVEKWTEEWLLSNPTVTP